MKTIEIGEFFSPQDIVRLNKEYKECHKSVAKSLIDIATPIFDKNQIVSLLDLKDDANENGRYLAIQSAIKQIQACVITKTKTSYEEVEGDFNGKTIKTQQKVTKEIPYYNYMESIRDKNALEKEIDDIFILPNYKKMKDEFATYENATRFDELVNELFTKYYKVKNPKKSIERFKLWCCNAKGKAFGIAPKHGVIFSLVGSQGKGKGFLANSLKQYYDKTFGTRSRELSFTQLFSNFNSFMTTRGMIHLDEVAGATNDKRERFKNYITEPIVSVERKNHDTKDYPNLVSFFSTTNESILSILGLQRDRRIVEVELEDRINLIKNTDVEDFFMELWKTCPFQFMDSQKVIDELLCESDERIEVQIREMVIDVFENSESSSMTQGKSYIYINKFKKELNAKYPNQRYNDVLSWCVKVGLFKQWESNRTWHYNEAKLDELRKEQSRVEALACDDEKDAIKVEDL